MFELQGGYETGLLKTTEIIPWLLCIVIIFTRPPKFFPNSPKWDCADCHPQQVRHWLLKLTPYSLTFKKKTWFGLLIFVIFSLRKFSSNFWVSLSFVKLSDFINVSSFSFDAHLGVFVAGATNLKSEKQTQLWFKTHIQYILENKGKHLE